MTIVSPPNSPQTWIDELPDEFADVTAETHDPADAKKLAYLATTKGGRRLYLNRSLVEADFWIFLTGRRFDPRSGVVDENCRVHGVSNLYVAGSSVFPTQGANNPTLTIVALALRLADHIKDGMK